MLVVIPKQALRDIARSLARIEAALGTITEHEEHIMTEQDQINADVAAVEAVVTDERAAVANIAAEVEALKEANPTVDVSGLDAAVADLQGVDAAVDALETPAEPAPAE